MRVPLGVQLLAGQQRLPLGYELERSSTEREMPERALCNRTMFAGERGRGVFLRYGLNENAFAHFGLWNNLTIADPQQVDANTFGDLSRRVAWHAGVHYYTERVDLGAAGFVGHRAGFRFTDSNGNNIAVPAVQREYLYLDGAVLDFLTRNLTLRAELVFGRDRVPTGGTRAPRYLQRTDILGYHGQLTYRFNLRNYLTVRYEASNPVEALTLEQLRQIYLGQLTNWRQVGGENLPIVAFSRDANSGTHDFFKQHVLRGRAWGRNGRFLATTADEAREVVRTPNAIAYGGVAYFVNRAELKLLRIAARAGDEVYPPDLISVRARRYPIWRYLYFYTDGRPRGAVAEFIRWTTSAQGQALAFEVGYFPL